MLDAYTTHFHIKSIIMLFVLLLLAITGCKALPQGAPPAACDTMTPVHGGGIPAKTSLSPYSVIPRRQGGNIMVTLTSGLGVRFQGFMLQARTPSREILGQFDLSSTADAHSLDCDGPGNTVTHDSPGDKGGVDVLWRPPQGYEGPVIFNATIAQKYDLFWVGIQSQEIQISKRDINDPAPNFPTRPPLTTPPYFTPEVAKESSTEFDRFYDGCTTSKLCFGAPANCVNTKNCKAVVAVTVSGDKYDFEMKAMEAMWVGVGLSDDDKMGDDSVIECVNQNNRIRSYMSYTRIGPYGSPRLSNPQLGIQLLDSSYIDGTIYCKVRRDVVTNVNGAKFDLVNDKYYLLVAAGTSVEPTSVKYHSVRLASGDKRSLTDVSVTKAASKLLIRLHGSFMLAAWIGTASIGVLLARYFRQTWVGTSLCGKDLWFAWHRMFMVLTWALTVTGFVLIFVELKAWSGENNPHAILGTITTILCFLQPIGAYFRPHPGTSKRPIFNWVHWFFGNAAHILAIVTIFFAVKLAKAELPSFFDWIMVAFVAFHVVIHLVLSIMGCVSAKSSERRITSFPMKDLGGSGRNSVYTDRTADAPYSGFRKCILGIYIVVVLGLMVALIVITALAPIEDTWNSLKSSVMSNS